MKKNSENIKEITKHLRTWIEIDTKAIDHNIALARSFLPKDTPIMAVVKSNAYGHSLLDFTRYIQDRAQGSVSWIGVDSITEAVALRKDGITLPMLIMGYSLAERFAEAIEHNISITISNMTALQEAINFVAANRGTLKVHIKIDTGLHRQGFLPDEISELLETLKKNSEQKGHGSLQIEGLYTHLADAKREEGVEYSKKQKEMFDDVCVQFVAAGFNPITHISASPALIRFRKEFVDEKSLVRLGAMLYGIYPSDHMQNDFPNIELQSALTWKTIISEIKQIPAGSSVGYSRSETVSRDTIVAVCPVGYWHGYPGALSSKGIVLVKSEGKNNKEGVAHPAKILGRVSMDMITIDCTDCPDVKVGDEVTLIGATGSDVDDLVSACAVAEKAGVSVHELLTRLNPKIKRIFTS